MVQERFLGGGVIEMFDASALPGNFSHPVLISENN